MDLGMQRAGSKAVSSPVDERDEQPGSGHEPWPVPGASEPEVNLAAASSAPPPPAQVPVLPSSSFRRVHSHSWGNSASLAVNGLFVLGCLYTLYFAQVFLIPVFVAAIVALILAPVVRFFMRLRLPRTAAAAVVCLALVGVTTLGIQGLSGPVAELIERAPDTLKKVQKRLGAMERGPLEKVSEVTDSVSQITSPGRRVKVETTTLQEKLVSQLTTFASSLVVILILIFFMLASGKDVLRRMVMLMPQMKNKKRLVAIVQQLGTDVSRYLITITAINLCLGFAVAAAMHATGVATPLLWGAMAFLFNFIPYLGALVGVSIVAAVSLVTFPGMSDALLPPALYLTLTTVEGMLVTPSILGRRLPVGPLAIMLGLLFWAWMWGIVGAFVAVPLLAATKIVCDRFTRTRWLGALLESRSVGEAAP